MSTEISNQAIYLSIPPITAVKSQEKQLFAKQPVVCKIAGLGEARSLIAQTCMTGKAKIKYLEHETVAFMAPEKMIEECALQTAGIENLKRIEIWAAFMTPFALLNPDLRYPCKKDIKLLKANAGNVLVPRAEHFLKSFLKDKPLPMSSAKYMAQQACYIQSLRYIFRQVMFRQVFRQASHILSVLQLDEKLVYKSPEISQ